MARVSRAVDTHASSVAARRLDRRGQPATESRDGPDIAAILELQRTAGNAAVSGLLAGTRTTVQLAGAAATHALNPADEAAVPTADETSALQVEWAELDAKQKAAAKDKTPFDPADAARLAEVNRLIGLRFKKDAALTLEGNGYADGPAKWFGDVKSTKFLGQSIRVHSLLATKLVEAETAFLAAVKDKQEPEGGWVRSTSTLRGPSEGLHGLGLAIDLNPGTNPYLVNPGSGSQAATGEPLERSKAVRQVIDRAVLLVLGRTAAEEDFGAQPDIEDTGERVQASYTKLSEASGALKTYFTLDGKDNGAELERLVTSIGARDPKKRSVDAWRKAIKADRTSLAGSASKKKWSDPTKGFLDLPLELVQALTGVGLVWLGDVVVGSGRDIMHFDMRGLGPIKKIWKSSEAKWTHLA